MRSGYSEFPRFFLATLLRGLQGPVIAIGIGWCAFLCSKTCGTLCQKHSQERSAATADPSASLRMTKERKLGRWKVVAWSEASNQSFPDPALDIGAGLEVGLADDLFVVEGSQLAVNVCGAWPLCSR